MGMHHYVFAHEFLPEVLLGRRDSFDILTSASVDDWLGGGWGFVAERLGLASSEVQSSDGLRCHPARRGGPWLCSVVTLPPPTEVTEAHMVALVGRLGDPSAPPTQLAYYTLELSSGNTRVLGQWADGTHFNHGGTSAADPDGFVLAIGEHLARSGG